jgi:hypothetical protein
MKYKVNKQLGQWQALDIFLQQQLNWAERRTNRATTKVRQQTRRTYNDNPIIN